MVEKQKIMWVRVFSSTRFEPTLISTAISSLLHITRWRQEYAGTVCTCLHLSFYDVTSHSDAGLTVSVIQRQSFTYWTCFCLYLIPCLVGHLSFTTIQSSCRGRQKPQGMKASTVLSCLADIGMKTLLHCPLQKLFAIFFRKQPLTCTTCVMGLVRHFSFLTYTE